MLKGNRFWRGIFALASLAAGCSRTEFTQVSGASAPARRDGVVIVQLKRDASSSAAKDLGEPFTGVSSVISAELRIVSMGLKPDWSPEQALHYIRERKPAAIARAQADHAVTRRAYVPNDPFFGQQWSLANPFAAASGGTSSIDAPAAWELARALPAAAPGAAPVLAIVDGGVDLRHPDLQPNAFRFANEIQGNGIDDDGNGYVDDTWGWNTARAGGVFVADLHGTHVAGIAAAVGDNGLGIAGASFAGAASSRFLTVAVENGTTSKVMEAYGYVLAQKKLWIQTAGKKGVNIVATNSSFGIDYARCQDEDYPLWNEMFDELGKVGILSAVAAPNLESDVDTQGDVPSGCGSAYLVKVTNLNAAGEREYNSGYGRSSITLGAPGEEILSTIPGGAYDYLSGTSMATPHVTGAIGFLYSVASPALRNLAAQNPSAAALQVRAALVGGVDPNPSLSGRTVTGGKLNLLNSARAISVWKP